MKRAIVSYNVDRRGNWYAILECGHTMHFDVNAHSTSRKGHVWFRSEAGRASKLGSGLDCPLCDKRGLSEPTVVRVGARGD